MLHLFRARIVLCLIAGWLSTACGPLAAGDNLPGTYHRRGESAPGYLKEIRFTETKCIIAVPLAGEVAQDYTIKDRTIYVGGSEGQLMFRIEGPGVISNRGTLGFEGTYEKGIK